jgi:hypothetical protein
MLHPLLRNKYMNQDLGIPTSVLATPLLKEATLKVGLYLD